MPSLKPMAMPLLSHPTLYRSREVYEKLLNSMDLNVPCQVLKNIEESLDCNPSVLHASKLQKSLPYSLTMGVARCILVALDKFTEAFASKLTSVAGEIFGLKSIAAYRSDLEINSKVTNKDAEEGLTDLLTAGKPIRITNKNLIDYIFLQSLEVAQSYDLPMQIHTGYQRLQPNTWSGAFKCWGNENKEAPLRAASPPGIPNGLVSNFEIKSFDATANPHLGLAAIIAAGIDGLRRHLTLPEPVDTEPGKYPEKLQRLPSTLYESLEAIDKDDDIFKEFIGEKLLTAIKAVQKADSDYYSQHEDAYKNLIHIY